MKDFEKYLEVAFIAFLVALGIYYMWLAAGTPMLGEDEGVYFAMANDFLSGQYPAQLGADPNIYAPFASLFYAAVFTLTGTSLAVAKALTALFALLTLLLLYAIGKRHNIYLGIFAATLLLSISMFGHLSMLAYQDVTIAFFSMLLTYMILRLSKIRDSVALGGILAITYFIKASMLLLVAALILYAIYQMTAKRNMRYVKHAIITVAMFVILLLPFVGRNLILYNYPAVEGLNVLFKNPWPTWVTGTATEALKTISFGQLSLEFYASAFGWLAMIMAIFGLSWLALNHKILSGQQKIVALSASVSILFLLSFNAIILTGAMGMEPRYLSIIFPQVAIVGGLFLFKVKEWKKWLWLVIIPILVFSVWSNVTTAQQTHDSQRYPSDYIAALDWVKSNTIQDSLIFTTYRGSLEYYADRNGVWSTTPCIAPSFIEIMTTNNSTFIYDALKSCNVSHILIWRATVAPEVVIPKSNIWGAFTYSFVDAVSSDLEHFKTAYQNQNNIVLEVI